MNRPKLTIRDNRRDSSPKARAEGLVEVHRLAPMVEAAKAAQDARRRELLSDPEFLRLHAERVALEAARDAARGRAHYYRFDAVENCGFFNAVRGQGDSRTEALEKAKGGKE